MAQESAPLPAAEVFSKLDLAKEGLEKVRQAAEEKDFARAASALLAYYRARKTVKHPVDPDKRASSRGHCASEHDLRIARDALKHVFISQPSYPARDCGKDIEWRKNPYPDQEWMWQLHRMYWWEPMGRAWWHTGDEAFAREWVLQFLDWRKKCPPDFRPAWRTLEAGIRGHDLCAWYHYFRDSESFTPEFLIEFLASAYDHAVYLAPKYSAGSNWGLMESEGLAFIAITFPEFKDAAVWRETALKRLAAELGNQVLEDGLQKELSFSYHAGCIEWFRRTADLAEMNGVPVPKEYREKIERLYHILAYALKPDGTIPMFGDCWNESGVSTVREGAALYKRPDLEYIASLSQKERRGAEPAQTSVAFPHSGYYFFRSAWTPDAIWLALKCGPNGGWHCQPDNCSFELFAHGSYLMPDSGCFIYSGDAANREWFNATAHHQCLTLDGKNSAYAPRLLLWESSPELTALTVENQSYKGLAHRRNVFFIRRKVFLVVDEAIGDAKGERRLHFQFGPPDAATPEDGTIALKGRGEARLLFKPILEGFRAEKETGQVAFQYGKKEPRSAFAYDMNGKPIFAAFLVPYIGETPPSCSASLSAGAVGRAYQAGDDEMTLQVTVEGQRGLLRRNLKSKSATLEAVPAK
ncbi:MAG: alginate lyase family protein [Planctomycetota bacterium]|nr:alginate lyase family protein [Planctomycetota bacterium]